MNFEKFKNLIDKMCFKLTHIASKRIKYDPKTLFFLLLTLFGPVKLISIIFY